jgi:hypothetical protein
MMKCYSTLENRNRILQQKRFMTLLTILKGRINKRNPRGLKKSLLMVQFTM